MRLRVALFTLSWGLASVCRAEIRVLATVELPEPGSLATLYCTGLVGIEGVMEGQGIPLPTSIAGVRISFGSFDAPLLAIASFGNQQAGYQQINFQVPYGASSSPTLIQGEQSAAVPTKPAPWGQLYQAVQHASDYRPVTFSDPPLPGEWIIAYGTNFGSVFNPPGNGSPAPLDRPSPLGGGVAPWVFRAWLDTVQKAIPLEVGFIGLAPGKIGVYQFNLRMPDPLPSGPAWFYIQRVANCGLRFVPGCGLGIIKDETSWYSLYQ